MFKFRENKQKELESIKLIDESVGVLKLGICHPYSEYHFKLPSNEKSRELSIYSEMKDIAKKVIKIIE